MEEFRRQQLAQFVEWVRAHIKGDEKGEAQVFLDHFFRAFGHDGVLEAGAILEKRVKPRGDRGTTFADCVWKPRALIEMKKRGEDLSRHLTQAFDYWVGLVPGRPRYTILCNFDEFRIYDFDVDISEPQDTIRLDELPDCFESFAFLSPVGEKPRFRINRLKVTRDAADKLATVYQKITVRKDLPPQTAQRFILQMLIALFSEDIELLPRHFVTDLLKECTDPPKAFDLIGGLFRAMSTKGGTPGGRFKEVPYFNGGIFSEAAPIELTQDEIALLRTAAEEYNWAHVSPDIFGTIFQHSLQKRERRALGAHYTTPTDIMKIVGPTIVQPWRAAIAAADSWDDLLRLQSRLISFRVLDPACGSGNFLYIAYRELKRIEAELAKLIAEHAPARQRARGQMQFGFLRTQQFFGMDVLPLAVELAKVTLTIAHKLSIDELHSQEKALPLDNLDANIRCVDALIASKPARLDEDRVAWRRPLLTDHGDPQRTDWPAADVIIGNPPFNGAKKLKPDFGPDYMNAIRKAYPDVPGMADYSVYWFRRAHDELPVCTADDPLAGRAGLVGTQNIRNNQSRVGGLDHIVKTGTIVEAVDNQPWSGEANVHVSIANWVKFAKSDAPPPKTPPADASLLIPPTRKLWQKAEATPALYKKLKTAEELAPPDAPTRKDKTYELAAVEAEEINSALSVEHSVAAAVVLGCNHEPPRVFNGQFPRHQGFVLTPKEAQKWLDADPNNGQVVHPYLIGREMLTATAPLRWVIDFQKMNVLDAKRFKLPFQRVEKVVLPHVQAYADREKSRFGKDTGQDQTWLRSWWQHFRCRKELIDRISKLSRYIACAEVTKRPIFCFIDPNIRPDHTLEAFTFEDDYSFGILQSSVHWKWFVAKCSKLTERLRYTPESVFDTFPWPQKPTKKQVTDVAAAAVELRRIRDRALAKTSGGLRALYRTLDLPGRNPLKDAHTVLDAAVLKAYGFDPRGDVLEQLLRLNKIVAARIERGESVNPPGIPPALAGKVQLVSKDCIKP